MIDLTQAVLVCRPAGDRREDKTRDVLLEEIKKRTGIRWQCADDVPESPRPALIVGTQAGLGLLAEPVNQLDEPGPEGFRLLAANSSQPLVLVVGADARGMFYGAARLLRILQLRHRSITLESELEISSTPRFLLRGHQLGYRPLNNTYDAWTPGQFDQYIRELALFGSNTIELVSPRSDDPQLHAPHMKLGALDMNVIVSQICDDYGLDVFLWYPNMEKDYRDPDVIKRELAEREEVFSSLPRLDTLFIPGGDPGGLDIPTLFAWCKRVAALLEKYHPKARISLSPQAFKAEDSWLDAFYEQVREEPEWLDSIVFAPWVRPSISDLRERIPARYPIRNYPDITHAFLCQYPVPRWDPAFAAIEGRECINPRPRAMKHIHNMTCGHTIGSVTYSEGVNDDVNKFVWGDQDWDPGKPVEETLREYARFFLGPDCVEPVTKGLLALERNWQGVLAENRGVEETLALWKRLEMQASPDLLTNWRFQQGLLRANLDAFIQQRLLQETEVEKQAWAVVRSEKNVDALDQAQRILESAKNESGTCELRQRCLELADSLWEGIGAQLTTTRHCGQRTYRGAFMDNIDLPLNDSEWMKESFERIRGLGSVTEQQQAIEEIVQRTYPGSGGYYDWFGDPESWQRVEPGEGWDRDPGYYATPLSGFWPGPKPWVQRTSLTAYYDMPIRIFYTGLDPAALYTLRVTYVSGPWPYHVRLWANESWAVHEDLAVEKGKCIIHEYLLPCDLTGTGDLVFTWRTRNGELGARIAETWLLKNRAKRQNKPSEP